MTQNLFSVPIFFIVFRETLEAAIIVSVLLGLAEQIVSRDPNFIERPEEPRTSGEEDAANSDSEPVVDDVVQRRRLLRKMRIQVNKMFFCQCQHRVLTR
jgi:high-affinity iron transporter